MCEAIVLNPPSMHNQVIVELDPTKNLNFIYMAQSPNGIGLWLSSSHSWYSTVHAGSFYLVFMIYFPVLFWWESPRQNVIQRELVSGESFSGQEAKRVVFSQENEEQMWVVTLVLESVKLPFECYFFLFFLSLNRLLCFSKSEYFYIK